VLGFVSIIIGILWSVNIGSQSGGDEIIADLDVHTDKVPKITNEKSLWSQLIPKTSIQKRDEVRALRQQELSTLVMNLQGIASAFVVLSDDVGYSIGQAHRPMTACVTVVPTGGSLLTTTVNAIRHLIAGATTGLNVDQVTVINSSSGAITTGDQLDTMQPFNVIEARQEIEDALGLVVATVAVTMEQPNDGIFIIPWRNNLRPFVHITVPQSWVTRRSEQVGGREIALAPIQDIVRNVVPGAQLDIAVIRDAPIAIPLVATRESYAKQVVMLVGLLAIFLSGVVVDRNRRKQVHLVDRYLPHPKQAATRILEMEHHLACQAIDSLQGTYKFDVLHAIVASDDTQRDIPMVQVQQSKQLELTRCG